MTPRMLRLNPNPEAGLLPERNNWAVYETKDIVSQIRHQKLAIAPRVLMQMGSMC
jgi:hypothetical protein